ncbi:hypothetical protein EON83_08725 [bacterium]|nr:MAG: hypothetical protein EON83_08725 [bacterium]
MKLLTSRSCAVIVALGLMPSQGMAQRNNALLRKPLQPLTPSKRGVVFKASDAREFGKQCSRQSPTGWWSPVAPSKAEIKAVEAALPLWIKSHQLNDWKASFATYYYQYGALVRGKKRLIYVNALAADDGMNDKDQLWRRIPTIVCDGGRSFWGIEYDVTAKRFQNASFNGRI